MSDESRCYYILGEGSAADNDPKYREGYPFVVWYFPNECPHPFMMGEGAGHAANSGFFPAEELVGEKWREHFRRADCLWLLPLLQRIAAGEELPPDEILNACQAHSGRPPERRVSRLA